MKDVCKAAYGEGPYILSSLYKQFVKGYEEWRGKTQSSENLFSTLFPLKMILKFVGLNL